MDEAIASREAIWTRPSVVVLRGHRVPDTEEATMARISPDGPELVDQGPVEARTAELGGYTVDFVTFKQELDMTPVLRGLPDDRCQCPHWGVVTSGSMSVRYADHDETASTGDVFYMPPGHVPIFEPGTQLIMFSPTDQLQATNEAIQRHLQALQGA